MTSDREWIIGHVGMLSRQRRSISSSGNVTTPRRPLSPFNRSSSTSIRFQRTSPNLETSSILSTFSPSKRSTLANWTIGLKCGRGTFSNRMSFSSETFIGHRLTLFGKPSDKSQAENKIFRALFRSDSAQFTIEMIRQTNKTDVDFLFTKHFFFLRSVHFWLFISGNGQEIKLLHPIFVAFRRTTSIE
jgi:hypothetical protein